MNDPSLIEHLRRMTAPECHAAADEIERLYNGLLGIAIHSSSTLAAKAALDLLQTIRHPNVDHWLGRND